MKRSIIIIMISVVLLVSALNICASATESETININSMAGSYYTVYTAGSSTLTTERKEYAPGEQGTTFSCLYDYGTNNTSSTASMTVNFFPELYAGDYIELTYYFPTVSNTLVSNYTLSKSFYIYGDGYRSGIAGMTTEPSITQGGSGFMVKYEPIFEDGCTVEKIIVDGNYKGIKIKARLVADVTQIQFGHSLSYTSGTAKRNGNITLQFGSVDDININVIRNGQGTTPEHNTDTCYLTDNNCDNVCDVCSRTIIDATENNRIMPTNRYLIEENPAMPDYTFYQTYHNTSTLDGLDAMCLFLVDIDTGLETRIAVPVKGVLVTPQEIKYYVDDQWLTVYKGAPLADAGWINDSYRMITFLDAKVTNDFKQFFFNQSLKKPNYSNYYEFCDKGIAYNGEFVARYENDDTPRVDWSNNYVVIYEYNEKLYIAQSFDYMQFGKVDGYDAIRLHDYSTYDYWVVDDETIKYMGVAQSFTPDALLAGNESIINWSDSTTYHYFDTGIRAFFGDESIFDENEEIDPDATWLERILYKVVEIREKINSIPKMIVEGIKNTLEQLFVPDQEYITHKVHYMFEQFSFLTVINDSMGYIKEYFLNEGFNEPPVIEINLGLAESEYYWGGNVVALDMTWYARYKPTVDAFLSAWIWLVFIYQLFTRLPNIVSGVAGDFKTIMTPAGKISKNNKNNGKEGKK